jgi:hypothetical protein
LERLRITHHRANLWETADPRRYGRCMAYKLVIDPDLEQGGEAPDDAALGALLPNPNLRLPTGGSTS